MKKFIALLVALVASLSLFATPASAAVAPERYISATLYTDTLPTKVTLGLNGTGYRTSLQCVYVTTGAGVDRVVTVKNGTYTLFSRRIAARTSTGCLYVGAGTIQSATKITVMEDVWGPWNPTASTTKYIW